VKFAFSTLACPGWSPDQTAANIVEYGYDGVEIRLVGSDLIDARMGIEERLQLKRAYGDLHIPIVCLGASSKFTSVEAKEREREQNELLRFVELASDLECPLVRTFGGATPTGASEQECISRVAESLSRVARRAEELGVRVVLETHDGFSSAKKVAEALRQIPSPAIGVLWDTHHPYRVGETHEEVLALLKERLYHVHVKDAKRHGSDWELVLLGEGEVPVKDVVEVLSASSYDGYVSVEWEKKWHPEIPDPEIALPQHLRQLNAYLTGNHSK